MTTREEYEVRLARWLEALRDPKRKQAWSVLNSGSGMCCLGVACDVSGEGLWTMSEDEEYECLYYRVREEEAFENLPRDIVNFYGLLDGAGTWTGEKIIEPEATISALTGLNDDLAWTFPQIADFIEANKERLFVWAGAEPEFIPEATP